MSRAQSAGLVRSADILLPLHRGPGGFDHAAVDRARRLLYVAHTANDALEVISLREERLLRSIPGLRGVAGVLVDESQGLVFTSNRGEDTVSIFQADAEESGDRIPVGRRPNGLAYDSERGILLCANVGVPEGPGVGPSVTFVDVRRRQPMETVPMPGRTRWTVFDAERRRFFVNIADPPRIVVMNPEALDRIETAFNVPAGGPHGLELDPSGGRLFCACDEGKLIALDAGSGEFFGALDLSGPPDVIFLNHALGHLYVAIGDPGVIDVIDVRAWKALVVVPTEAGAHTIALDEATNRLFAFLPGTHRAAMFLDAA